MAFCGDVVKKIKTGEPEDLFTEEVNTNFMEGWKVIADKMKNSTTTKAYTKTEEFQNYFKIEKINYIS